MLGQPVSMLIPRVVGFKLNGDLPEGATATDLVLTITEMLRKHGVVGKFVEFYGPGVSALPLANRATIGNMSPEFGSTIAVFPIDEETMKYLELTGRSERAARAGRGLRQGAGPLARPGRRAALLREARARPGHRRPVAGRTQAAPGPGLALRRQGGLPHRAGRLRRRRRRRGRLRQAGVPAQEQPDGAADSKVDEASDESFPSSDAPSHSEGGNGDGAPDDWHDHPAGSADGRPSNPAKVTLEDGTEFELDHGAVAIAAITSCTNTSNPSVMIGAALLAKNAVEKGLQRKPWVKTTLAPGSKVVSDYYERAGLTPYLDKLGFNLVGYGCTTCIGNSGPAHPRGQRGGQRQRPRRRLGALGQPQLRGPDQPRREDELPRVPAAGRRLRAGRLDGRRPLQRPARPGHRRQRRLPQGHLALRGRGRGGHRRGDHLRHVHRRLRRRLRRRRALAVAGRPPRATPSRGTRTRPTCGVRRTSTACRRSPRRSRTSPARGCCSSSATR